MTDLDALPALLARVEEATGPDRELDAAIFCLLCCNPENTDADLMDLINAGRYSDVIWKMVGSGAGWAAFPPLFTSSLDATVALVETKGLIWLRKHPMIMTVYRPLIDDGAWAVHYDASAATPSLALLAALLRSMIEEEGK